MYPTKMNRFNVYIDTISDDLTRYFGLGYWVGVQAIESVGETLEELQDNALVYTIDQDGGEGPQISFQDLPRYLIAKYRMLIENEYKKQIDKELSNG